jgi:hypothetical protein
VSYTKKQYFVFRKQSMFEGRQKKIRQTDVHLRQLAKKSRRTSHQATAGQDIAFLWPMGLATYRIWGCRSTPLESAPCGAQYVQVLVVVSRGTTTRNVFFYRVFGCLDQHPSGSTHRILNFIALPPPLLLPLPLPLVARYCCRSLLPLPLTALLGCYHIVALVPITASRLAAHCC